MGLDILDSNNGLLSFLHSMSKHITEDFTPVSHYTLVSFKFFVTTDYKSYVCVLLTIE